MIEKMTKYDFILLSSGKESFLESLRALGVVDITRSSKPVDEKSAGLLAQIEEKKNLVSCIEKCSDPHLQELEAQRALLEQKLQGVKVWGEYDAEKLGMFNPRFYCVPQKKFDPEWENEYPMQIVSEEAGKVWFVVLGECGIPVPAMPAPDKTLSEAEADLAAKNAEIDEYRKALEGRRSELPALEAEISALHSDLNLYLASITATSAAEETLTVYEGFAPADEAERLAPEFDALDVIWMSEDAVTEDNPPIKLRNNSFVKQFEVLTDMYGRPAYDGFDPTPYISIFFLLFFAMCMGDAGYGLILIIVGLLLKKVDSFKSLAPLVTLLGGATVIVGLLFHTFFSVDISAWKCIPEGVKSLMLPAKIAGYDGTMVLALAVGIVHLCLAMVVKTVYATKNHGFLESLGTWGWTLLIVGGVIVGAIALAGVLDSAVTRIVIIVLGIVSGLCIFLLNDLHRNPLKNVGAGLWEAYNTATGVLGDVLSYLRLYALGLAGSMLGFAFNDLAAMALGDGGVRWIFFILIVVIGHTLNIAMAALGAFVHPLRLNFLEFFKNSGYEGSGRNYSPLKK